MRRAGGVGSARRGGAAFLVLALLALVALVALAFVWFAWTGEAPIGVDPVPSAPRVERDLHGELRPVTERAAEAAQDAAPASARSEAGPEPAPPADVVPVGDLRVYGRVVSTTVEVAGLPVRLVRPAGEFAEPDDDLGATQGLSYEERREHYEHQRELRNPTVARTTTDALGRFELTGLAAGSYLLVIDLPPPEGAQQRVVAQATRRLQLEHHLDLGDVDVEVAPLRRGEPAPVPDDVARVQVTVSLGQEPCAGVRARLREVGSGISTLSPPTDERGQAFVDWDAFLGEAQLFVERDGEVLGSAPPRRFPVGELSYVDLELETGVVAIDLVLGFDLAATQRVQVVLEAPHLPPNLTYSRSLERLAPLPVPGEDAPAHAVFASVPAGDYTARAVLVEKLEGLGWRTTRELGRQVLHVSPGAVTRATL